MRHLQRFALALAVTLLVAQARGGTQAPAGVRFDEFAPTTFSVVTHDTRAMAAAWADVLGIAVPPINQPDVTYPPSFEGDRTGKPTMASLTATTKLATGLAWLTGLLSTRVMLTVGAVLSITTFTVWLVVLPAWSVLLTLTP